MGTKLKKGDVFIRNKDSDSISFPTFAICIINEKWDEVKQQYIVHYVRAYNFNNVSSKFKFFSYSEKPSECLNNIIKKSYFKVAKETNLPQLIKAINKLTSKTLKNTNISNCTPISDVTKYYLGSHTLFMESKENRVKFLLISPYEEDKGNFFPPNIKMNLIEINVSIFDETRTITYVLDKPITLWGFIREYPNAVRINQNNTLVLKVKNLWDTAILKPTQD